MRAKLYGHRGARGERPENTIAGFRHARALGLAGVETDIALTADFVPVLHHDAELPDGRLIKHLRRAELPAEIPTLAEALRAAPGLEWLLEIKTYPPAYEKSFAPALMVEKTLAVLAEHVEVAVWILAFDWAVLRAVAERAPRLRRACLTAPDMAAARETWWGAGFSGLSIPRAVAATGAAGWAAFHGTLSEAEIAEAKALGLKIFAWTVNEPADFNRLSPHTDGIITDTPARLLSHDRV